MTDSRYPLTAGAKNAEQGRDIKVDSLRWVMVDALPVTGDEGCTYLLSTDGLIYQWWNGAWRAFSGGGGTPVSLTAADIAYTNPTHPSFATVKDALDFIFYVPLSLSSFSNNVGSVEHGTVVANVTFNWSYNKAITSQSITPGYPALASALRTLALTGLSITTNTTWSLSATDGSGSVSGSTGISFLDRRRWGVSAQTTPDSALLNGFSSELATSRNQTRTFNPSNQYLYFSWPSSFGTPTFTINSFPVNSFIKTTFSYTNGLGYSTNYDTWRSLNLLTGSITVVVT